MTNVDAERLIAAIEALKPLAALTDAMVDLPGVPDNEQNFWASSSGVKLNLAHAKAAKAILDQIKNG